MRRFAAIASLVVCSCAARHQAAAVDAESEALAEDGSDTNATESDAETMVTSFLAAASARTPLGVATAPGFYQPAGCLQVTRDDTAQKATYVFDRCTGPLGLVAITGTVNVGWTAAAGELDLAIDAAGVSIGRATIDAWSGQAKITASGVSRTMQWSATLSGTTRRGRPFQRASTKTVTWSAGGSCVDVDGTSDGTVAARTLRSEVTGYERCGACPRAGTIAVTNVDNGRRIELTFDGSGEATFTAPNGAATRIALPCAG